MSKEIPPPPPRPAPMHAGRPWIDALPFLAIFALFLAVPLGLLDPPIQFLAELYRRELVVINLGLLAIAASFLYPGEGTGAGYKFGEFRPYLLLLKWTPHALCGFAVLFDGVSGLGAASIYWPILRAPERMRDKVVLSIRYLITIFLYGMAAAIARLPKDRDYWSGNDERLYVAGAVYFLVLFLVEMSGIYHSPGWKRTVPEPEASHGQMP